MLDVASLLAPSAGLITDIGVVPAQEDYPIWRIALGLACEHADGPDAAAAAADPDHLTVCSAGACSTTRTRAVVRAAGEAIERIALHGAGSVVATTAELGDKALQYWASGTDLGAAPGDRSMSWYPATRLADGSEWWVPAGLVLYPGTPQDRPGFDVGPSGAAAGQSYRSALHAALLETVERDAVIVSWARQQHLLSVDTDAAPATAQLDPEWTELRRSLDVVRQAGLKPVFARIPLGTDRLVCVVGGVAGTGRHHRLLSLGAKVSTHPAAALYGALHESFQLYPALQHFETPDEYSAVVVTESDRIRFLASASGIRALESWLCDPVVGPVVGDQLGTGPELSTDDLVSMLIADGLDPYVVDLTDHLPEVVRRQGWSVVKVVPAGYQPLRIDERTTFGWNRHRLGSVSARTGVPARLPIDELSRLPHPLP